MDVHHIAALLLVVWCGVAPGQPTYDRQCQCEYTVDGQCAYTLLLPAGGSCPGGDSSSRRQVEDLQQNFTALSVVALRQSERLGRLQEHVLDVQSRLAGLTEKLTDSPQTQDGTRTADGTGTQQEDIRALATNLDTGLRRNNETMSRLEEKVSNVAANVSVLQSQAAELEATQKSLLTRLLSAEQTLAGWQRTYRLCTTRGLLVELTGATSQVSTTYDTLFLGARQARLRATAAWCPREPNNKEWIQFDFTQERIIYGVVTRGRADYAQWVTSYKMLYSSDASEDRTWTTFRDVIGDEMVFTGNSDQNTLQVNTLWQPINARYVRLMPLSAYQDRNLCMRADVIGCVDA